MMSRNSMISIAAAMVVTLAVPSALADNRGGHRHHHGANHVNEHGHSGHKHSQEGIAIAVGAAALIAAAAAAKAHENKPSYEYHHGYGGRDNAIAACVHKAHRRTVRRGGYGVTLRDVRYAKRGSDGWRVAIRVKQRLRNGRRNTRGANCSVVRRRVVSFNWR